MSAQVLVRSEQDGVQADGKFFPDSTEAEHQALFELRNQVDAALTKKYGPLFDAYEQKWKESHPEENKGTEEAKTPAWIESLAKLDEHDELAIALRAWKFCDKLCLRRYLRATVWKLDKAFPKLMNTLEWRRSYGVDTLVLDHAELLLKQSETGKVYCRYVDREGHPIITMIPERENLLDHDANLRHVVYTMERAVKKMEVNKVEKLILMVDFKGFSIRNSPPFKTSKATLDILMDHYPERLFKAFCVNPPWAFWAFWKMISPFLDKVTFNKVGMISGSDQERAAALDKWVEASERSPRLGGTNMWDMSTKEQVMEYWADEVKMLQGRGLPVPPLHADLIEAGRAEREKRLSMSVVEHPTPEEKAFEEDLRHQVEEAGYVPPPQDGAAAEASKK